MLSGLDAVNSSEKAVVECYAPRHIPFFSSSSAGFLSRARIGRTETEQKAQKESFYLYSHCKFGLNVMFICINSLPIIFAID